MPRKRKIPEQSGVPGRIREIRDYATLPLTDDWFAEDIVTCIREMRRWLADPKVPDSLRAGDWEVLEKLLDQLAERWRCPPNTGANIQQSEDRPHRQTLH